MQECRYASFLKNRFSFVDYYERTRCRTTKFDQSLESLGFKVPFGGLIIFAYVSAEILDSM